jgi:hypothetical protein
MNLELSEEKVPYLTQKLHNIVENDRYLFSPRIRTVRAMFSKFRPEPVREPLPPPKVYAPPPLYRGQKAPPRVKSEPRPPATPGSSVAAVVRLIVWCRDCRHQVDPDPAESGC